MKKISLLLLLIFAISCSKVALGKFWTKFRQSEIISEHLDHGPFGGTTEINWQRNISKEKEFKVNEIVKYGKENGWNINTVSSESLLHSDDFSSQIFKEKFGNARLKGSKIICFESNFLTINEDKNIDTQENCFVILYPNEMILYHRWGDYQ